MTFDPAEWVLVPRRITKEMMLAGDDAATEAMESDRDSGGDGEHVCHYSYFRSDAYELIYQAMVAAAPSRPDDGEATPTAHTPAKARDEYP